MRSSPDTQPHLQLGILGHTGHGRTTLLSALTKVLAETGSGTFFPYDEIRDPPPEMMSGNLIQEFVASFTTPTRSYELTDSPGHLNTLKTLLLHVASLDGAVVVVSAVDGPTVETSEQLLLARRLGATGVCVFLNKAELVDGQRLEHAKGKVRELLSSLGFPGSTPLIEGSALCALEGRNPALGRDAVLRLLKALDSDLPLPVPPKNRPLLISVESVSSITGRGTVISARVERGTTSVGQSLELLGFKEAQQTMVTAIEKNRQLLDSAQAGDFVGIMARIAQEQVMRGQVLAMPGTMTAHTGFEALVYVKTQEEGGRSSALLPNSQLRFVLRTAEVSGTVTLASGVSRVIPGTCATLEVKLTAPIAMEQGLRFRFMDGLRSVGAGIVLNSVG